MDWTQILITLITVLVPTGGFTALFTIREKKLELMLNNAAKLNEGWANLASEYKEQIIEKDKKLAEKDEKIDEQYRISSSLRHKLDDSNTRAAVAEVMLCDKVGCGDRNPPLGTHMQMQCKGCDKNETLNGEE